MGDPRGLVEPVGCETVDCLGCGDERRLLGSRSLPSDTAQV